MSRAQLIKFILICLSCLPLVVQAEQEQVQQEIEPVADLQDFNIDLGVWSERQVILKGLEDNLRVLERRQSDQVYSSLGISQSRVEQSLRRFRKLLLDAQSRNEFLKALQEEFVLYRSRGNDGTGTVRFTGYFQPVYQASLFRTAEYQYPIYRQPSDFIRWAKPHPSRVFLEGYDGKGSLRSPIHGQELAWLRTRYEVFMVQVQGSALLQLINGEKLSIGFAAGTDHKFTGISKDFLKENNVAWNKLADFFSRRPEKLNQVMARNNRFIFFKENPRQAPLGSLGVPVIPERSIATDKQRLLPAALGLVRTVLPVAKPTGGYQLAMSSRLVLDQDTGSAIKGPGRVDIFMGTGPEAQRKANAIFANGELFYFLLKNWNEEVSDS